MVVGEVGTSPLVAGELVVQTHSHSYFSRMAEAALFERLRLGELYRRGLEQAEEVALLGEGAEWIQSFDDFDCPTAVRILDFPHAAERVCQIGEVVLGQGHASLKTWQQRQLHQLKHDGPDQVLASLRSLAAEQLGAEVVAENLAYLEKRLAQLQYPSFQAIGWPLGSGIVESANKVDTHLQVCGRLARVCRLCNVTTHMFGVATEPAATGLPERTHGRIAHRRSQCANNRNSSGL